MTSQDSIHTGWQWFKMTKIDQQLILTYAHVVYSNIHVFVRATVQGFLGRTCNSITVKATNKSFGTLRLALKSLSENSDYNDHMVVCTIRKKTLVVKVQLVKKLANFAKSHGGTLKSVEWCETTILG